MCIRGVRRNELIASLGVGGVSRLTVLLEDGRPSSARWRDDGVGDGTACWPCSPHREHPAPAFVDQLAHEYGLKDELDGRSARGRWRLCANTSDHGCSLRTAGAGLSPGSRRPMELGRFLRFATGLSAALRMYTNMASSIRTSSRPMCW